MKPHAAELARITATAVQIHDAQKELRANVNAAREAGATWRDIAEAIGTTVSSTYRKYSQVPDEESE